MSDDRDKRWPRPRTLPSDSEPPDTVSGEISVDDSDEELLTLTPPPVELERLLHWTTRKLPNKLQEIVEAVRHVKRTPADHDRRLNALERDLIDLTGRSGDDGKLGELRRRVDDMETRLDKHDTALSDLNALKWKLIGATTAAATIAGLLVALITKYL